MELKDLADGVGEDTNAQLRYGKREPGQKTLRDDELIRFNLELKGVFKNILDSIDVS